MRPIEFSDSTRSGERFFSKFGVHQHLRTAAAKWRPGGADDFFLNAAGGGWDVNGGGESIDPSGNPTKIDSAISLLRDLGLWAEKVGRAQLTDLCRDVFRRVIDIEMSRASKARPST